MYIGIAKTEDKDSIKSIWEYCFEDPDYYNDYYFENIFSPNNTIIAKNEGKIIGSLQMRTYTMKFFKHTQKVALIVGISTLPEYRGQKVMHDIMLYTIKYLHEKDYSMMFLTAKYPIIYKRYGFNYLSSHKKYDIPLKNIPEFKVPKSVSIKSVNEEEYNILASLYNKTQLSREIFFDRDASLFKQLHEELLVENGDIYVIKKDDIPIGYFFSILSEDKLIIREFVYKDNNAIEAFFSFLFYHQGQVSSVSITSPKDEMFEEILNWDIDCKAIIKPFILGRILNISKFSDMLEVDNCSLKITDKIIISNTVTINNDNINVVNLDIGKISQLLFNYINLDTFKIYNQIKYKDFNLSKNDITPFINQYI